MKIRFRNLLVLLLLCSLFAACSSKKKELPVEIVYKKQALEIPEGVVRYCWEEPIVEVVQHAPGLDTEGKWYNPHYKSLREVRQGQWRPCEKVYSKRAGDFAK